MKTILSDIALPQLPFSENVSVFDSHELKQTAPCTGCFSCWIKSPGACIFQDDIASFTASMKQSDTLYILTENVYGSYSPFVKCAIDRSLSYVQPYFTIRNHEMHHVLTSPTHLQLIVIAYGSENKTSFKLLFRRMESIWIAGMSNVITARIVKRHLSGYKPCWRWPFNEIRNPFRLTEAIKQLQ